MASHRNHTRGYYGVSADLAHQTQLMLNARQEAAGTVQRFDDDKYARRSRNGFNAQSRTGRELSKFIDAQQGAQPGEKAAKLTNEALTTKMQKSMGWYDYSTAGLRPSDVLALKGLSDEQFTAVAGGDLSTVSEAVKKTVSTFNEHFDGDADAKAQALAHMHKGEVVDGKFGKVTDTAWQKFTAEGGPGMAFAKNPTAVAAVAATPVETPPLPPTKPVSLQHTPAALSPDILAGLTTNSLKIDATHEWSGLNSAQMDAMGHLSPEATDIAHRFLKNDASLTADQLKSLDAVRGTMAAGLNGGAPTTYDVNMTRVLTQMKQVDGAYGAAPGDVSTQMFDFVQGAYRREPPAAEATAQLADGVGVSTAMPVSNATLSDRRAGKPYEANGAMLADRKPGASLAFTDKSNAFLGEKVLFTQVADAADAKRVLVRVPEGADPAKYQAQFRETVAHTYSGAEPYASTENLVGAVEKAGTASYVSVDRSAFNSATIQRLVDDHKINAGVFSPAVQALAAKAAPLPTAKPEAPKPVEAATAKSAAAPKRTGAAAKPAATPPQPVAAASTQPPRVAVAPEPKAPSAAEVSERVTSAAVDNIRGGVAPATNASYMMMAQQMNVFGTKLNDPTAMVGASQAAMAVANAVSAAGQPQAPAVAAANAQPIPPTTPSPGTSAPPASPATPRDPQADKIAVLGQQKSVDVSQTFVDDVPANRALANAGLGNSLSVSEMAYKDVYCVSLLGTGPQNANPDALISTFLTQSGQKPLDGGIGGKLLGSPETLKRAEDIYRLARTGDPKSWEKFSKLKGLNEWRAEGKQGQVIPENIAGDFQTFLDKNPQFMQSGSSSVYVSKETYNQLLTALKNPEAAKNYKQAMAEAANGFGRGPTVQAPPLVVPPKTEPTRVEILPAAQKDPELAAGAVKAKDNWNKHLNPQSPKPAGTRAGLRSDQSAAIAPQKNTAKPDAGAKTEAPQAQGPYGITGSAAKLFRPQHP